MEEEDRGPVEASQGEVVTIMYISLRETRTEVEIKSKDRGM